jgi:hypothetical protein
LKKLKPILAEVAEQYGLRAHWTGGLCKFSGAALGYLKVGESSLILAARLSYAALFQKKTIEKEINRMLDAAMIEQ